MAAQFAKLVKKEETQSDASNQENTKTNFNEKPKNINFICEVILVINVLVVGEIWKDTKN